MRFIFGSSIKLVCFFCCYCHPLEQTKKTQVKVGNGIMSVDCIVHVSLQFFGGVVKKNTLLVN